MAAKQDTRAPLVTMWDAAEEVGVHRNTISRWVRTGRLKRTRQVIRNHLICTLVDLDEVRAEVAKITRGRPNPRRPKD